MAAAHVIIGGGGGGGGSSGPLGELASNPFSDGTNGKTKARHSFVSFFLGTLFGNFITLIFMSMTLVLLGTGAWMAASCGQMSCEIYPDDFWSSWWLSWGVHFDPGTQTGIDPREGFKQKWVVVSFSILGFILNLIFLGLIVENIRVLLDSWRRTYGRIIENDHTVVLGWTDKTLFLLGELAEMMTDSQKGGGTIVVLGEMDTLEMRMEIAIAFPDWGKRWKKVRVRYYNGKPYEVDDLLKVAVYAAERVIVLGCSRRPRVADSQMLTTICALRCLPGARFLTKSTNVIAELKQPQNEPVVCHIGGESEESTTMNNETGEVEETHPLSITPVVGNHAANAIMGLCALDPSAGLALLDLMNFSGDQIETIPCTNFTSTGNTTFGVLRNSFTAATPLGVKVSGKDGMPQITLAPDDEHVIGPDTFLLVIAEDIASALASSKMAAATAVSIQKARLKRPVGIVRAAGRFVKAAGKMPRLSIKGVNGNQVGVDPNSSEHGGDSVDRMTNAGSGLPEERGRCIIFIGWQRGFESLLRLLDARLPPKSEVHILSEQTALNRTLELASEGLALDGSAMKPKEGEEDDPDVPKDVGLSNCQLIHIYGYTTDERAMRRLPLARADAAVVVADANEDDVEALGGAELQIADSESLTSTILLRRLRTEIELGFPDCPPLTIVTEFVDLLTRRLLERQGSLITSAPKASPAAVRTISRATTGLGGDKHSRVSAPAAGTPRGGENAAGAPTPTRIIPSLGESSTSPSAKTPGDSVQSVVFHRNYIETTALSLASHSNTSWVTVQMLLDPHSGQSIRSVPVEAAVALPESSAEAKSRDEGGVMFSFSELSDTTVTQSLGLLIGWRRSRGEVVINPPEKIKQMRFLHGDELIVLKNKNI